MRETGYVASANGPAEDTESYYKRTPAPGARSVAYEETGNARGRSRPLVTRGQQEYDSIPDGAHDEPQTEEEAGWLSREAVRRDRASKASSRLPLVILLVVGGLVLGISGMTAGIVVLVWSTSGSEPPPPPPVEQPDEPETWQGLRVKKGLR